MTVDPSTQKPDKSPRNPHTRERVSVVDPSGWATFDECVNSGAPEVGFILTETDPFVIIDLDRKPDTSAEELGVHDRILQMFPSYVEKSVSGNGYHIILSAKIGGGLRRASVEIYDQERYMLTTGNFVTPGPIQPADPVVLDGLVTEMGGVQESASFAELPDEPERRSDQEIAAALGDALTQPHPPASDKSQEDYKLLSRIVWHTRSKDQARRLFENSGYYRPEKGKNYVTYSLAKVIRQFRQDHPYATSEHIEHGKQLVQALLATEFIKLSKSKADDKDPGPISVATFKGKTLVRRRWLVQNLIPMKKVTLLSGDGGTGKSLLALMLSVSVVRGEPWLGLPVHKGKVLFLSAEDDNDDLEERAKEIAAAEGVDLDQLENLHVWSRAGMDALLASIGREQLEPSDLYKRMDAYLQDFNGALVVIDTSADTFPGDEIKRVQVRQFVQLLARLAIDHDLAVLLLSHPSLEGMRSGSGTSGSTAWNNSVRSRLYFERLRDKNGDEENEDERRLTNKKNNYARSGTEIHVRYDEGRFVVIGQPGRAKVGPDAKRVFLRLLERYTAQGRRVNSKGRDTYAPKMFAQDPDAEGIRQSAFVTAMNELFADKEIQDVWTGSKSRQVSHIEKTAFDPPSTPD